MRLAAISIFALLTVSPAYAATSGSESGVRIWRGPAPATALAGEAPAAEPCASIVVNIGYTAVWPDRHLRVHGFYSGDRTSPHFLTRRRYTQGFYADRMARGY